MAKMTSRDVALTIATGLLLIAGFCALYYLRTPLKDGPWRVTLYTGNAATRSWLVNTRPESVGTGSCYKVEPDDGNVVIVCGSLTIERGAP